MPHRLLTQAASDLQAAGQKGHIQSVSRLDLGAKRVKLPSASRLKAKGKEHAEPAQEASTSERVLRPRVGKGLGTKA